MRYINFNKTTLCIMLLICVAVAVFAILVLIIHNTFAPQKGEIAVVRIVSDMKKGEKISEENIRIDYVREEVVPLNAIRNSEQVVGKFLTADVVADDYIFPNKLSDKIEDIKEVSDSVAYISVKQYLTDDKDIAEQIQQLINSNPGKTLYFADGTYLLSKPLFVSADSAKKVSLNLSDYAVLKADDNWSSNDAIVHIGAVDSDFKGSTNAGIKGGILDGNNKAIGISVEGGRDNFISNMVIRNTTVGIALGCFKNNSAKTVVEHINIVGNSQNSVGISITSDLNTLESIRVSQCLTGVKLSGKSNTLRNISVVYNGNDINSRGFDDNGQENSYESCNSQNFPIGFYMGSNVKGSIYTTCYAFWNNKCEKQIAFETEKKFNSVLRTCRADFNDKGVKSSYLTVGETGGRGTILWPVINDKFNIENKTFESYLSNSEVINVQ